jgi:iron complex outermembrane recepter protein
MYLTVADTTYARILRPILTLILLLWGGFVWAQSLPVNLSIPASALSKALIEFAQQAKLSVIVSEEAVNNIDSPAVVGSLTTRQALDQLLMGTGLGYRYINNNTIAISADFDPVVAPVPKAVAQTSEPEADLTPPIENIIVTALRHSANLQKTSAAITVLDRQTLEYDAIQTLDEVGGRVPGLTVTSFSLGQPTIHMRGIGSNDDGAAMDQSVVVFIDDVYMGRITGINLNMLDLAQVEVLRGPQGALYGKNVIGGAIKLNSQIPLEEPELTTTFSTGNFDYQSLKVLANGSLSENLLGRFVVQGEGRDGWQENLILGGEKQHDDHNWGLRGQLLYTPSSVLELHWSVDFSQDNLNSTGRIPLGGTTPITILDNNGNPINQPDGVETRLPKDIFDSLGGDPLHATNGVAGYTDRDLAGFSLRINYQFGDVNLTSITAVRDTQFEWLEDSNGLPRSITNQRVSLLDKESHRQFSQELRWYSDPKEHFSYLLGLYYLYEHTVREESFLFNNNLTAVSDQDNHTKSYAVFGQLNYQLSSDLTISLGGRYTQDTKELNQRGSNGGAPSIIFEDFEARSRAKWRDFSPQLTLSYDIEQDVLLYASLSKGVKSGGFQGSPGTLLQARKEISPEYAWDYELGLKSQWWHNRMRFNVAGFYIDYQDLQVVQFQTLDNFGSFVTSNAASASVRGVELELGAQLSEAISFTGSYAFLRATYDDFNDSQGRDFAGNVLRQAPKHSVSFALQHKKRLASGTLQSRIDYRFQSESFREPDNIGSRLPTFRLFDANVSFMDRAKRWQVSVWAKNLLDSRYISHLYVLGGNDYGLYGTPRTYGLSVMWRFL